MFVDVQVDESDVAELRKGQAAEIRLDAFPDEVFSGVITRVDPQAVTQQNIATVLVTVEVKNPAARLLPGMTATCAFVTKQVEDTLYVPSRALRRSGEGYAVTLRVGAQRVETPVEIGMVGDDTTEILEGLREGEEVELPVLSAAPGASSANWARERGMRMGGAAGFMGHCGGFYDPGG